MNNEKKGRIKVMMDGPYQVSGANLLKMKLVKNSAGRPHGWESRGSIEHAESYELCRCGASKNKLFCDGTHADIGFQDKE